MKSIVITFKFLLILVIAGCSTQLTYYNSTADFSKYSKSISTEAKLIKWPEDIRYSFGLVVATDKNTSDGNQLNYALFVPSSSGSVKQISDLRLAYASPVTEDDLENIAQEIDKILRKWSNKTSPVEATYYEFYSGPDDETINSLNTSGWYPSVKFEFQNTEKHLVCVLTIGPDSFKYKYTFDEMKELGALQMMVAEAIDELRVRDKQKQINSNE